jgi:hypothetical protein
MYHQQTQALSALWEAVRLAEPEGHIRCFLDEGALMKTLLSKQQQQYRSAGPTSYLDNILAAFSQQNQAHTCQSKRTGHRTAKPKLC